VCGFKKPYRLCAAAVLPFLLPMQLQQHELSKKSDSSASAYGSTVPCGYHPLGFAIPPLVPVGVRDPLLLVSTREFVAATNSPQLVADWIVLNSQQPGFYRLPRFFFFFFFHMGFI
jgi:hypothetical protein